MNSTRYRISFSTGQLYLRTDDAPHVCDGGEEAIAERSTAQGNSSDERNKVLIYSGNIVPYHLVGVPALGGFQQEPRSLLCKRSPEICRG
jgi:hypothetical protein